jgi:cell wall-associated NlpC family hydrolase
VVARPPARAAAAATALSLLGAPYRYGGASPAGFDCSGLVVYSYARAGVRALPHSAERLERLARPVRLDELEPGDLLFFRLSANKTSHVGIYVGERSFVHVPSGGKRVERVRFDHVYWAPHLGRAGRLEL